MTCSCCGNAIPQVSLSLLLTSFVLVYSHKVLPRGMTRTRATVKYFTYIFAGVIGVLAVGLVVLSNDDGLRAKTFAKLCGFLAKPSELDIHRCGLLQADTVYGKVLEFGPGPGTNFRCLGGSNIESWTGVEPNESFRTLLEDEAKKFDLNFPISTVWLKGETVDIEASSVDTVIGTHVLCSVTSPTSVLANINRALKEGGTFHFMEHINSPKNTNSRTVQDLLAPIFTIIANGCTFKDMQDIIVRELGGDFDISMEEFDAPMPLAPFIPHLIGKATKKSKGKGRGWIKPVKY